MITFVSSLLYLNNEDKQQIDSNISLFLTFVKNLNVVLFVSMEYLHYFDSSYSYSLKIIPIDMNDSWVYSIIHECSSNDFILPSFRNHEKDTYEFLLNAYIKYELLENGIQENIFNSNHFAWIDFTTVKLFKNPDPVIGFLTMLNNHPLKDSFISIPGCWNKLNKDSSFDIILNSVYWRFCGGYFLGDKSSILTFCKTIKDQFSFFLKTKQIITWDFNIWAWIEINIPNDISWYSADHNESLLFCSADHYTFPLNIYEKIEYNYPLFNDNDQVFYPTSASYIFHNNQHWLNTRFVNYWIYPNGNYLFNNKNNIIENKNVLSLLNDDFFPIDFKLMNENINITNTSHYFSQGLEDIRLYHDREEEESNIIKYIATTIGFSSNGKSKMIYGDYDLIEANILNGTLIDSPNSETNIYEKNWIPLNKNKFIYKWNPFQFGIIENNNSLKIIETNHINNMIFNKMRGSTCFVETEDGLIGLIHFSEEHHPRHYYHMMVMLNKETIQIIKYSNTFCFEKLGIEFCLGFTIHPDNNTYIFWISRHDRDPLMIKVKIQDIPWKYKI
jgi:hypothetical protein